MKLGFVKEALFNRFSNKKPGDMAINEKLGLIVQTLSGVKPIISAEGGSYPESGGAIRVGEYLVQYGRVTKSETSFSITYTNAFSEVPIYVNVQGASNDAGIFNNPQIDGMNLPTTTLMNVVCEAAAGGEYYYWMAIGKA